MASNTVMPAPNSSNNPINNIHNNMFAQKISFDGMTFLILQRAFALKGIELIELLE